jgi:hypothetical protein
MKSPPLQYTDNQARELTERYIAEQSAERRAADPAATPS